MIKTSQSDVRLINSRDGARARKHQLGVTLLEILVVLAIMGALVAITAPALDRYIDAATFKSRTELVGRDIARLRISALVERRTILFPQADQRGNQTYIGLSEPLPDGWSIEGQPVVFLESGACVGGELTLTAPDGRAVKLAFDAPHCRFDIESL